MITLVSESSLYSLTLALKAAVLVRGKFVSNYLRRQTNGPIVL